MIGLAVPPDQNQRYAIHSKRAAGVSVFSIYVTKRTELVIRNGRNSRTSEQSTLCRGERLAVTRVTQLWSVVLLIQSIEL